MVRLVSVFSWLVAAFVRDASVTRWGKGKEGEIKGGKKNNIVLQRFGIFFLSRWSSKPLSRNLYAKPYVHILVQMSSSSRRPGTAQPISRSRSVRCALALMGFPVQAHSPPHPLSTLRLRPVAGQCLQHWAL